jgi:hypothetical protein
MLETDNPATVTPVFSPCPIFLVPSEWSAHLLPSGRITPLTLHRWHHLRSIITLLSDGRCQWAVHKRLASTLTLLATPSQLVCLSLWISIYEGKQRSLSAFPIATHQQKCTESPPLRFQHQDLGRLTWKDSVKVLAWLTWVLESALGSTGNLNLEANLSNGVLPVPLAKLLARNCHNPTEGV